MKRSNKKVPVIKFEPDPASVPMDRTFQAELCGSDDQNFVYIQNSDSKTLHSYMDLRVMLDYENAGAFRKPLEENDIRVGLLVIIKEEEFQHFRARILQKYELGMIKCFKIDDGVSTTVLTSQIYSVTSEDLEIPCSTIKCRLEGMQLFDGLPHLEMAYKLIKLGEVEDDNRYLVQVVGHDTQDMKIPIVRMLKHDQNLSKMIQKFIPKLCEMPMPKPGVPNLANIVHGDSKSMVWFRSKEDEGLLGNIEATLEHYKEGRYYKEISHPETVDLFAHQDGEEEELEMLDYSSEIQKCENMWKEPFLKIKSGIYIATSREDKLYYRVRLLRILKRDRVEVEFIDFGDKDVIDVQNLISVKDVDENLAFVPPQCIKARFYGFYRMDYPLFLHLCPAEAAVVVMDMQGRGDNQRPDIEIFTDNPDISINESWITNPQLLTSCDVTEDAIERYTTQMENIDAEEYVRMLDNLKKNGLRNFPKLSSYVKAIVRRD